MAKTAQVFTIRNGQNQFLGTIRACTAEQAINLFKAQVAEAGSRRYGRAPIRDLGYKAEVETSNR